MALLIKWIFWPLIGFLTITGCEGPKSPAVRDPVVKQYGPKISPKEFVAVGEEISCKPEGQLGRADCPKLHICVPNALDRSQGTCMMDCGGRAGDKLIKRKEACPSSHRCMLVRSAELSPLGMFCQKSQPYREMSCNAPLDPEACADGLSCIPTISGDKSGKTLYTRFRCKKECGGEDGCPDGEECLMAEYQRKQVQASKPCEIEACNKQDPSCPCDMNAGFFCEPVLQGVKLGMCIRQLGICGKPVPWAKLADFRGKNYVGQNCNELNDSRLCQIYAGAYQAMPQCQPLGKSGEGLCIAPCFIPTFDERGGHNLSCPDGFSCRTEVAEKLGLLVLDKDQGNPKPCDEKLCPNGKPCPEQCGPGGSCLNVNADEVKGYFCAAYASTCLAD